MNVTLEAADEREPEALEGLLRWYADMGVDAPIDEVPHDRFAQVEPPPPVRDQLVVPPSAMSPGAMSPGAMSSSAVSSSAVAPSAAAIPRGAAAPTSSEALVAQAEALAAAATTLDALRTSWEALPGCGLAATASRMIFAGGAPGTRLMFIGSAPSADDERQGEAFCGPAGALLDAMLRAIGLDRTQVYLANLVPWRPPGSRPPTPLELSLCLPFARRHIALASPAVLVCLGERAAQPLLGSREPVSRLRGRWLNFESETATIKTLVTFSPDYLIMQPLQKRRAWLDLLMLAAASVCLGKRSA